jgi:hypothetical protein
MTIEAGDRFGWPAKGIAYQLRRHPNEVKQLVRAAQALDEIKAGLFPKKGHWKRFWIE